MFCKQRTKIKSKQATVLHSAVFMFLEADCPKKGLDMVIKFC